MTIPRFPDPLNLRAPLEPGAVASAGGLSLEQRVAALEQGAASRRLRTKAGIPSDADYATPPVVGTLVIDTTNSRLYVKTAAATWKYAALT